MQDASFHLAADDGAEDFRDERASSERPAPVEVRATVAVWLSTYRKPHELTAAMQKGDAVRVTSMVEYYGAPDQKSFGDYTRIGEADITLRLIPKDEQVRLAVQGLQKQLEEDRAKWLERQRQILQEIQNLQAITYEAETVEA